MIINKTLFVQGVRCHKLAYLISANSEDIAPDSPGVEFRKRQGTLVGELEKKVYATGIDLEKMPDEAKLVETRKQKNSILFEASAQYEDLFARADVLLPNDDGTHTIIEAKSDTEIKDEHILDVSFQKYVFENAGYKISKICIAYVNNKYVKNGALDLKEFFVTEDVTGQIMPVEDAINELSSKLSGQDIPEIKIGGQCTKPYDCQVKDKCWSFLKDNNVMQLYYDKKIGFKLLDKKIYSITDIPDDTEIKGVKAKQRAIQIKATKENKIHIQKEDIKEFIESLEYPLHYFDFETYAPAIPIFDNSKPWQKIPFQYSLHIEKKDDTVEHKGFLATDNEDPRPAIITSILKDIGKTGSIIVFNQNFEKSILSDLARDFPEYEKEINDNILPRIIDLASPFEKFHYYNPRQHGRYSIKVLLPIFSKLDYKENDVSDGEEAFIAYEKIISNAPEKKHLIEALEKYCALDTLAELEIMKKLREIVSK